MEFRHRIPPGSGVRLVQFRSSFAAQDPNFLAAGKVAKFRDSYEFKAADEMVITSSMLIEDGKCITLMTATAKRE
jgi:hypothetical protein